MNFHQTLIAPQRLILICNQMGVYKTDPNITDEQTPPLEQPVTTLDNLQCWLSPNPVNNLTTLFLTTPLTEEATITLTDIQGKAIGNSRKMETGQSALELDCSTLATGIYLLKVKVKQKEETNIKLIKNE